MSRDFHRQRYHGSAHLRVVSAVRPCPAADVLAAFAAGELRGDELEPLERHLADCSDCLGTVACLAQK